LNASLALPITTLTAAPTIAPAVASTLPLRRIPGLWCFIHQSHPPYHEEKIQKWLEQYPYQSRRCLHRCAR